MGVTITYLYPFTVAPTVLQMIGKKYTRVIATVAASAASDTSAVITHSFGLTDAEITQGFPFVSLLPQDGNQITSPWFEASQNPNYTVLQKGVTDAGGQVKVTIQRPHTIIR